MIFYLDLDVVKFDLLADALERADKSLIMHFASIEYLETVIKNIVQSIIFFSGKYFT